MKMTNETQRLRRRIRVLLLLFLTGLLLGGLTAFPIRSEAVLLQQLLGEGSSIGYRFPGMARWISHIHSGIVQMSRDYPFMMYATDWLAFAHIVIAIAFIGPLRDPVKNIWVIQFGMIACVLVIPLALICGPIRGFPLVWLLVDCSFGIVGFLPLWFAYRYTRRLAQIENLGKELRPAP